MIDPGPGLRWLEERSLGGSDPLREPSSFCSLKVGTERSGIRVLVSLRALASQTTLPIRCGLDSIPRSFATVLIFDGYWVIRDWVPSPLRGSQHPDQSLAGRRIESGSGFFHFS